MAETTAIRSMYDRKSARAAEEASDRPLRMALTDRPLRAARTCVYILGAVAIITFALMFSNKINTISSLNSVLLLVIFVVVITSYLCVQFINHYHINIVNERFEDSVNCRQKIDAWITALRSQQSIDFRNMSSASLQQRRPVPMPGRY